MPPDAGPPQRTGRRSGTADPADGAPGSQDGEVRGIIGPGLAWARGSTAPAGGGGPLTRLFDERPEAQRTHRWPVGSREPGSRRSRTTAGETEVDAYADPQQPRVQPGRRRARPFGGVDPSDSRSGV